jgi:hypothetical protein
MVTYPEQTLVDILINSSSKDDVFTIGVKSPFNCFNPCLLVNFNINAVSTDLDPSKLFDFEGIFAAVGERRIFSNDELKLNY